MKIGYDAKRFFNNKSGLGNYSRSLIKSILLLKNEFTINFYTTNFKSDIDTEFIKKNPFVTLLKWIKFCSKAHLENHVLNVKMSLNLKLE